MGVGRSRTEEGVETGCVIGVRTETRTITPYRKTDLRTEEEFLNRSREEGDSSYI